MECAPCRPPSGMCEDCSQKRPTFGVPGEVPKNRWCVGCAQKHTGAVSMRKPTTCEDCTNAPTFGVLGEVPKNRWCAGCAQKHTSAVSMRKPTTCEDCTKQPTFGVPGEVPKNRWCAGCAQKHTGAVSMRKHTTCEDCTKQPTYGVPGEVPKRRWCAGCAQKHTSAVSQRASGPDDAEARALYKRTCAEEYKTLRGELMADAGDGSGQCECVREGCKCRQNAAAVVVATNQAPTLPSNFRCRNPATVPDHTSDNQRADVARAGCFDLTTCTAECLATNGCAAVNALLEKIVESEAKDSVQVRKARKLLPSEIMRDLRLSKEQKRAHLRCRTDKLCEICHNDVTDERGSAHTFTTDQVAVEAARLAAARQARGGARLVLPPQDRAVVTQEALAQQAIDELEAQLATAKEKLLHAQAQRMQASSE